MRLRFTIRHGQVDDDVRAYVETKLTKLERRLKPDTLVEVVLDRQRNPKIVDDHVVEAEIYVKGPNIIARESAPTFEAAADLLVDRLERQLERQRDKRVHEPRRRAQTVEPEPIPVEEITRQLSQGE